MGLGFAGAGKEQPWLNRVLKGVKEVKTLLSEDIEMGNFEMGV